MAKSDQDDDAYETELAHLQLALVKYQQHAMESGDKVLIILEGRDAAGKDGTIKRMTEHLSIRATRVMALPKPSEVETTQWYFQRYVQHLPAAGQVVIFNRSWYNRAGVERVMDFATPKEQETFLRDVPHFEEMLVESGMQLVKIWLDISREEQAERLKERRDDPLKALKISPLDDVAQEKWAEYSSARDEMLTRTHNGTTPWTCVVTDKKKDARLNVMRHVVRTIAPKDIAKDVAKPDNKVLFQFEIGAIAEGRLNR
ncbi:MAG: polyphosphate kinase 2 [Phenylobacterium sp.]|uniref:polyphosphate kinase 2 n=1 Tax=Phenylobacterium sp. TaxID=1871053 RepID=UPI002726B0FC|nr:polyphosphate kinase 2 [Phenylobacterium sp.]MDO9429699.1 polyphosphate kinase 2 [Phenylobacterium sp.]